MQFQRPAEDFTDTYFFAFQFLVIAGLLIMLWGAGGILVTIYNTFIAESPPYLDYDWAEVMSRHVLLFGVGCLVWGVGKVFYAFCRWTWILQLKYRNKM